MTEQSTSYDDSTSDQIDPEWEQIEAIQNFSAKALRQHDAGKQIEASDILRKVKAMLDESPMQAETSEPPDIASGAIDYWSHVAKRKTTVGTSIKGLDTILERFAEVLTWVRE